MDKTVLVTGARGFLGRQIVPLLQQRGYRVHALSACAQPMPHGVECTQVDLLTATDLQSVLEKIAPTHLLHLAWCTEPSRYLKDLENFTWLAQSLALLKAFYQAGGTRVVMAGTCAEYDWRYGFCDETLTPCAPNSPYGTSKLALHNLLLSFCQTVNMSAAWARIFWLFGPHEAPSRLVASVTCSLLSNQPARCSHGLQRRDYLHVSDAADAFANLLDSRLEGAINIASGDAIRLADLVTRIGRYLQREELIQLGAIPSSSTEPPLVVANVRRLTEELNWRPSVSLQSRLEQSIEWWRDRLTSQFDEQ